MTELAKDLPEDKSPWYTRLGVWLGGGLAVAQEAQVRNIDGIQPSGLMPYRFEGHSVSEPVGLGEEPVYPESKLTQSAWGDLPDRPFDWQE